MDQIFLGKLIQGGDVTIWANFMTKMLILSMAHGVL